jgi:hypothetical protein
MPFKSKAQKKYLYANEPKVAKKFEKHTPKGMELPEKIVKRKGSMRTRHDAGKQRATFGGRSRKK